MAGKKRHNRRRADCQKLKRVDQVAAKHNMPVIETSKLATKASAGNEITPDLALTKLFKDQRKEIALVENKLKTLGVNLHKEGDDDRFRKLHADLADMVPQLKSIVVQQARLTAQQEKQSTDELYLALDVEQPKIKRTPRSNRGGTK